MRSYFDDDRGPRTGVPELVSLVHESGVHGHAVQPRGRHRHQLLCGEEVAQRSHGLHGGQHWICAVRDLSTLRIKRKKIMQTNRSRVSSLSCIGNSYNIIILQNIIKFRTLSLPRGCGVAVTVSWTPFTCRCSCLLL